MKWMLHLFSKKRKTVSPKALPDKRYLTRKAIPCPVCGVAAEITEQGLCESCGNIIQ